MRSHRRKFAEPYPTFSVLIDTTTIIQVNNPCPIESSTAKIRVIARTNPLNGRTRCRVSGKYLPKSVQRTTLGNPKAILYYP
jgi:hypothetical protein